MILPDRYRQILLDIFASADYPFEVWAYGSRVNGSAHEGSDLDLAIRSRDLTPLPGMVFNYLCDRIRNSNIPIIVELRDWARLPESFHRNITANHELLYSGF